MKEEYSEKIALHYAAYRPPLHQIILKECISELEYFNNGLDIGCGTGYSAIALADFCSFVYGVDPGREMLQKLISHYKVQYINSTGNALPFPDQSIDIVTFAGSLYYAKCRRLVEELRRVCVEGATIITYDFNIILNDILDLLKISLPGETKYDHEINFSGDSKYGIKEIILGSGIKELNLSCGELSHILLSSNDMYRTFSEKYSSENPYIPLKEDLEQKNNIFTINTRIYYSRYLLEGIH